MMPTLEAYQQIAADNRWLTILPEIAVAMLALAVLVLELLLPATRRFLISPLAIIGQLVVAAAVCLSHCFGWTAIPDVAFNGLIQFTLVGEFARVFFPLAGALTCYIGTLHFRQSNHPQVEFHHITLVLTAAFMVLAQANHFVTLFLSLETITVGFFILTAYRRGEVPSLEAGLKFLILAALSSAILLFGIVLIYGTVGNPLASVLAGDAMRFEDVAAFANAHPDNALLIIGILLVLTGIGFKIGLVPFHIWIPDVYQGAPTPVTGLLAVSSKAAGIFVLIHLLRGPFEPLQAFLAPLLTVLAMLSILFGNVAALGQRNVKRLMGLSGISHAGFLMMGVVVISEVRWAVVAINFYLFVYLIATFAVFIVMTLVGKDVDSEQRFEDYENLMKRNPILAGTLTVALGSLAGIPPFAGFIGKLILFIAVFMAGHYLLLAIAAAGAVISIYYYFAWIRSATFTEVPATAAVMTASGDTTTEIQTVPRTARVLLIVLALASIVLGLFPFVIEFSL